MKITSALNKITSKGFTLIELLIVIAILGVLAAGVLAAIDPADKINAANDARVQNDISALGRATETYATTHNNSYPAAEGDLVTAGELKRIPEPPSSSYTYTYTATPGGCTTAAEDCTAITITSPLLSNKFSSTPFWRYESSSGKNCAVATAATACP